MEYTQEDTMNKDVKVIGITGAAKAGKTTLADCIGQHLVNATSERLSDHVIAIESFAAPIKSMVAMLLDFFGYGSIMNPETLNPYLGGDKKEEVLDKIGVSTRTLMQTLGTEWGRNTINDSIWIDNMEHRIGFYGEAVKHGHKGAVVIIDDVRFDNEAEVIRKAGGTVIKVTTGRDTTEHKDHASEGGVDDSLVHYVFENDGSVEELDDGALAMLENVLGYPVNDIITIPEEAEGEEDRPDGSA